MADLSITAANVGVKGKCQLETVQVGESVTQGQAGYFKVDDQKYYKADANASATTAEATGVFLSAASTDGYAVFVRTGAINLGAALTAGETYVVSATAGGIAPIGDTTTGWWVTILGTAASSSQLDLNIRATGNQK